MINIFATNSYHSGARYIHRCLSQVDQSKLDTRHIVIVPDRCSLEAERQLLATVGGSFNIAVLTFRRLAGKILPQYQYLSKQSGVVAMSSIIQDCSEQMLCYTKGNNTVGFAENMYDTISQLKYCKIDASSLLVDNLPRSISDKLHDIGTIYNRYNDFMQGRYIDSADKLDLLCDSVSTSQYCADSYFYLYDFDNFTAQELSILSQLMIHSRGVSVACCVSNNNGDRYLYLNDIYHSLLNTCANIGVKPNIISDTYHTNAITAHIGKCLYRYDSYPPIESGQFVSVFEGNTVVNEVYQLACLISRHVREGGRYRDVFVITSDVNNYANAVHTIFGQLGIPYFCDQQFCLADHVYSQLILDFLNMCNYRLQIGYVHSVVKNPLLGYGDRAYSFVNYTTAYNVNYRLDAFTLGTTDDNYVDAEQVRDHLYNIYTTVDIPSKASASQYVDKIRLLIQHLDIDNGAEQFATLQANSELEQLSKVSEQVAEKFSQVLTSIADVLGDRVISLEDVIGYLANGIASVNISVLPTHTDSVIFANMAKSRKHDIKVLAILGANHSMLPMTHKDTKLLTDFNVQVMNSCGLNITPDILVENKRDRFSLYQLLCEPTDRLHISYACSVAGESLLPSSFVSDIRKMFVVSGKTLPLRDTDSGVYSRRQALSRVVTARQALQDNQIVNDRYYHQLSQLLPESEQFGVREDMQNLTIDRGGQLMLSDNNSSITKITSLYDCPYRFYHRYGLDVKPIETAQLDASIIGNILHEVLEKYLASSDKDIAIVGKIFDKVLLKDSYKAIFSDPAVMHKLRRLRVEAVKMCSVVAGQLSQSSFSCIATELEFGGNHADIAPVSVPYSQGTLNLTGKIDRVDRWGDMFTVVDYKSGSSVEYSNTTLYTGEKLQLLVYLKAIIASYQWKPAGFYYFRLHNDFDNGGVYKYTGRTLADKNVIKALDNTYDKASKRFNIKEKNDGAFYASSPVLTEQQLNGQIQYATDMISQAGDLMDRGYIAMTPYKDKCDYCDYANICDYGDIYTHAHRHVKAIKEDTFGGEHE